MRSIFFFLSVTILFTACASSLDLTERTIEIDKGKFVRISVEKDVVDGEHLLIVDYLDDTPRRTGSERDKRVQSILEELKAEAESGGYENALIKYRYLSGEQNEKKSAVYKGLLYEAERREDGSWKIRKVN